jgi:hypothetical protein
MPRHYSNSVSKSGRVAIINTRIKRKDVLDAVVKTRTLRKRAEAGITKANNRHKSSFVSRLPGEIRTQIYSIALDVDESSTASKIIVPRPRNDDKSATHASMSLLRLSKEINIEARSILEARATAYIPITPQ